jgi:ankyrin repeat protein
MQHHESLVHHAVESNQPTIVQLLIKYGAKIDFIDDVQQMPIHKAVYHGYPECLKILIDNGSPLSFKDMVLVVFSECLPTKLTDVF